MFAIDPRLAARIRQNMKRVLILEENAAYARMLADMLRVLGAESVVVEADHVAGLKVVDDIEPNIILTEYRAAQIDGIAFTRELRKSKSRCRQVPVIMIKGDVTPAQLLEARNCGVHEVLMKPFAWQDLVKRLQNVLFKPRDWIEVVSYTGPDRRRFNTGEYSGSKKRKGEAGAFNRVAVEEAVRMVKASVFGFDSDPESMMQTVMQQMVVIVPACKFVKDPGFVNAVSQIVADLRTRELTKETLQAQVGYMMSSLGIDGTMAAVQAA